MKLCPICNSEPIWYDFSDRSVVYCKNNHPELMVEVYSHYPLPPDILREKVDTLEKKWDNLVDFLTKWKGLC